MSQEPEAGPPSTVTRERPRRRPLPLWASVLVNLTIALVIVSLVQHFVVRVHNVRSGSMQQTLGVTDRILSSDLPYLGGGPARGDIVIFWHGDTWEDAERSPAPDPVRAAARVFGDITGIGTSSHLYTVKRVIGLPGDQVECCDVEGRVMVNGEALDEPYIFEDLPFTAGALDCSTDPLSPRCFARLEVPEGPTS